MKRVKRIPISLVQKVMEACRINALAYLDDARMILSKGRFGHAYVSVQIAIEELGKLVLLKERRDEAWKTGKWEVSIKVKEEWKNHRYKAQKAWTMLNPDLKHLHVGALNAKVFDRKAFDVSTEASHITRLEYAYVEFDEESQSWYLGPVIDKSRLEALIQNVEKALKDGDFWSL